MKINNHWKNEKKKKKKKKIRRIKKPISKNLFKFESTAREVNT